MRPRYYHQLLPRRRNLRRGDGGNGHGEEHVRPADAPRRIRHLRGLGRSERGRRPRPRRRVGLRNERAISRPKGGRARRGGAVRAPKRRHRIRPRHPRRRVERRNATPSQPGVRRRNHDLHDHGDVRRLDADHRRRERRADRLDARLPKRDGDGADRRERERRLPNRYLRNNHVPDRRHCGERRNDEDILVHRDAADRLRRRQRRPHRRRQPRAVGRDALRPELRRHGRLADERLELRGRLPQSAAGNGRDRDGMRRRRPRRPPGHARPALLHGLRVDRRH